MRGGPWTAPLGAPPDLQTPPLSPRSGLWLREGHAGRALLRVPLCALLRHAGVGSREQVQPPLPLPCRRASCGWGRPPGPGGAEGRACGSPAGVGAGGGGGGGATPPPALGPVWEAGGGRVGGGPWVPWRCLLSAKGGGRLGGPGPGGQPSARGVAPFPRPPLPRAGFSRSPSLGPLIPRPSSRGADMPGVAVRVSGQWLAGCGAAGFPPRLLSPHSLPREVARRFPWVGNKAGVTGVVLSMGGVATHTIPVRAHPASLGTICAASRCAGVGPLVLRGPHLSRRLGRGGGSHSGLPSRAGGVHPFCLGGWGPGPLWLAGRWGGGGGGVAPRPPCSRSRRRPVVLLPGSLRVAGALPSGARVRSGLKCRPEVGGVTGGQWTAPLGAPSDLKPSLCHLGVGCGYWRVMWGAASFLLRCARCSGTPVWVRGSRPSRRCPYRAAVPPEGGAPPRPWGGGGPRLWLPCCGGCGGGGGRGGRLPARPRVCAGGGGVGGGPLAPWRCLSSAGGEGRGRHGGPGPGGQPSATGSRPSPAPPIESRMLAQALAGALHPPAVVARRWPAGVRREG